MPQQGYGDTAAQQAAQQQAAQAADANANAEAQQQAAAQAFHQKALQVPVVGRQEQTARKKLFKRFALEYGTTAYPAVSTERYQCLRAWLHGNDHAGCRGIVGEMRQYEYVHWLKQQVQAGTLRGQQLAIAQDILGQGQELQPVHKKKGEIDERTGRVVEGDEGAGLPWGMILIVAALAGGAWWYWGGKAKA
jgi:hypothetical protein